MPTTYLVVHKLLEVLDGLLLKREDLGRRLLVPQRAPQPSDVVVPGLIAGGGLAALRAVEQAELGRRRRGRRRPQHVHIVVLEHFF